jgi:hypothetical protein
MGKKRKKKDAKANHKLYTPFIIRFFIVVIIFSGIWGLYQYENIKNFLESCSFHVLLGFVFGVLGLQMLSNVPRNLRNITVLEFKKFYKKDLHKYDKPYIPFHITVLPLTVGLIERTLYIISFLIDQPLFVAFWLTLKTAPTWKEWETSVKDRIPGRAFYNIFLAGSGISILYSLAGYSMIYWGNKGELEKMLLSPLLLAIVSILFDIYVIRKHPHNVKPIEIND